MDVADFDAEGFHRELLAAARRARRVLATRGVVVEEHRFGGVGGRAGCVGFVRARFRTWPWPVLCPLAVLPPLVIPAKAGIRSPSRSGGPPRLPARVGVTRRSGAAFASPLPAPLPPAPLPPRPQHQRPLATHPLPPPGRASVMERGCPSGDIP